MDLTNGEDWLKCVEWLNDCNALTEMLRYKYERGDIKLNDFVFGLRDGVVLCNLANALIPGCIELTEIDRRAQESQLASLKNIKLFLNACRNAFSLRDDDLFHSITLYNLDIQPVMRSLSILSRSKIAENATGRTGFTINTSSNERESIPDIYYNIVPEEDPYVDERFILDGMQTLEDQHDSVYQQIMANASAGVPIEDIGHRKKPTYEKRDHVLREIYESESKFVRTLDIIIKDFAEPMSKVLGTEDFRDMFINIEELSGTHTDFLNKLKEAVKGKQGRTKRICGVFEEFKEAFMCKYVDYFAGMQKAISKVDSFLIRKPDFKVKYEECRKKSEMKNFKLTDLIRVPYQRVLKYHLLIRELKKNTDIKHDSMPILVSTLSSMDDLASYLNEAQRDKEIMDRIEYIFEHLQENFSNGINDIKNYGHIVKDDNVRIKHENERIARTRTLILFEKALLICKTKGDNLHYKDCLILNEYRVEDNSGSENTSALQFVLKNHDKSARNFILAFKNDKDKAAWKKAINDSIEKNRPKGYNANGHAFQLYDFKREITWCGACKKVLCGVFYQGFRCAQCGQCAHKDCVAKLNAACTLVNARVSSASLASLATQANSSNSVRANRYSLTPSLSFNRSYNVRAFNAYNGKPVPPDPEWVILKFNAGDVITVIDDDDDVWWKGYKAAINGSSAVIEGYFPKGYVKACDSCESNGSNSVRAPRKSLVDNVRNLEDFSWYCSVDRPKADLILSRIPCDSDKGLFLVRPRQDGGYAISIKFNNTVEHIKIHSPKQSVNDSVVNHYCLVEQKRFNSVVELVKFYSQHSLEENFPQLKTTLGVPFRDALPQPICRAVALHDYEPGDTSTGVEIEIRKGETVYVLGKEDIGWWRVFNANGLIGYSPGNYLKEIAS